jgi:magnesium transporter
MTQELAEKIRRHLASKNGASLRRLLARHNFADIAEVLDTRLSEEEAVKAFQYLNVGQAAQVLTSLQEDRQIACLSSMPIVMGSQIIRTMAVDDAVDILQEMDTQQSRRLLDELPLDSDTRALQNLLLEEPDTAAGLMSTDYIEVMVESTVGDAMSLIRRAEEKDFIYYCYLVDDERRLIGVVSLKTLILHDDSVPLNRIAHFDIKSLLVSYDQELVANIFRKYYNLLSMPVVDLDNRLCGVITLDDIIDVIDEETSEELYRASGISLEDMDEKNLIVGPVINAFKARMPWLSITMVGQLLASGIIAHFDKTVSTAVIAVSFMPLLTGLSGNMGTQTETITVRGMSQGLIHDDNIREKYFRELKLALMTGASFGIGVGALSYLFYKKPYLSLLLASWIAISLCISASMGMLLPYLFKKLFKVDPAGMGGPVITTLSDILTFTIYLSVITLLLSKMV